MGAREGIVLDIRLIPLKTVTVTNNKERPRNLTDQGDEGHRMMRENTVF